MTNPVKFETPLTNTFRAWLVSALAATDQRPSVVARAIGASVNSVGAFIRDPERDITLGRAAQIERHLRACAAAQSVSLPAIKSVRGAI